MPLAIAEIESAALRTAGQQIHRTQVRIRQVLDMDEVAHAGPIGGIPIGSEETDGIPLSQGDLQDQRDQVGLWGMILAQPQTRPGGIEITQANRTKAIGLPVCTQDFLYKEPFDQP